jgi:hypothetical protein
MVAVKDSSNPIDSVLQQGARRSRVIQRDTHAAVRNLSSALSVGYGPKKVPEEHLPKVVNPEPAPEAEIKLEPVAMPKPASALETASTALTDFAPSQNKPVHNAYGEEAPVALGPNEVFFPAGRLIFEKGEKADFFYVLVSGKVALFEPSNQAFTAHLEPGSSFGEQAILVGGVRSLTAQAAEATVCKAISAQTLSEMLNQGKGVTRPLVYALLLELSMTNDLKSQGLT